VEVTRRGAASWARLAAPERANACGPGEIERLHEWLAAAPAEEGVRALVLTGTGRAFCAGADVAAGAEVAGDPEALLAYVRLGRDLVDALAAAPLPTIAAVNGVALAGGLELVLACDLAVASRAARLGDAHARYGIVPGWGSSARLPRLVGARAATRLLLTGVDVSADEALRLGLVNEVVEPDALEAAVDALVEQIAAVGPSTSARLLALARGSLELSRADALEAEWAALRDHVADPELRAGVARFLDA
jgi:enoyl-CoA hydratase/carnithine racemase